MRSFIEEFSLPQASLSPKGVAMQKFAFVLLMSTGCHCLLADAENSEVYTCTFMAHTPVGTLSGDCTTQSLQDENSISRWKMTLTFDQHSAPMALKLKTDSFYDLVRTQCLDDGSFTTIMPLWGDLVIMPRDPDYLAGNRACSPAAQTVPDMITMSQTSDSPLTLAFLFDQRRVDFDVTLGLPTRRWIAHYWESFQRLSGNAVQVPRRPGI
jgi:hypothetical protein